MMTETHPPCRPLDESEMPTRLSLMYQIAAGAATETQRIIPGNLPLEAIYGEHGSLIRAGLGKIAGLPEGRDCHGVRPEDAEAALLSIAEFVEPPIAVAN